MAKAILSREEAFESAYRLIESLLRNPEELELNEISTSGEQAVGEIARYVDSGAPGLLSSFLKDFNSISADEYVQIFELAPTCPLYLGHYLFKEPTTCATAGTSGRNMYMIELIGIYGHLGLEMDRVKEMPDYLPVMVEFLWLSLQRREDPIREKFIREYLMPALPKITGRLAELKSPYLNLLEALECIVKADLELEAAGKNG